MIDKFIMKTDYNFMNELILPAFQPPSWLFAPVWATLYILIAVAFFALIFAETTENKAPVIAVFVVQMLLNLTWTPVFFGLHKITLALAICLILTVFVLVLIVISYKISKLASFLLVPYFLWLTFASILNVSIVVLNPNIN